MFEILTWLRDACDDCRSRLQSTDLSVNFFLMEDGLEGQKREGKRGGRFQCCVSSVLVRSRRLSLSKQLSVKVSGNVFCVLSL